MNAVCVDVQQSMFACLAPSQLVNILCCIFVIFRMHVVLLKESFSPAPSHAVVVAIVSRHFCNGAFCGAPPPHSRLALVFFLDARRPAPFTEWLSLFGAAPWSSPSFTEWLWLFVTVPWWGPSFSDPCRGGELLRPEGSLGVSQSRGRRPLVRPGGGNC